MNASESGDVHLSLFEHLRELRNRLLKVALFFLLFFVAGLCFSEEVYFALMHAIPEGMNHRIGNLTDPFLLKLKLSFYVAIFFSLPIGTYQTYCFVRPALEEKENRFAKRFIGFGFVLLIFALLFTYYFLPFFIKNLLSFAPEGIEKEADVMPYISTILSIYLGFAILFQLPLMIYLSIIQGFVKISTYRENRKWVIVILLTLCAIFSPPDVLSQLLIFIPLYLMFELTLLAGRFTIK